MESIRRENALNMPNLLTLLRIGLLPAVVVHFRSGDSLGALALYGIAMLTDAADGVLARRLGQVTTVGKLLDPIADKLTLLTLLMMFAAAGQIPAWVVQLVFLKELALVTGSAAALRFGIVVYARPIGKVSTFMFMLSMLLRFLRFGKSADFLLGISLVLMLAALAWYSADLFGKIIKTNTISTK